MKVCSDDILCCIKEMTGEVNKEVQLTVCNWYVRNATGRFAALKYLQGFIKNSILVCFSFYLRPPVFLEGLVWKRKEEGLDGVTGAWEL